MMPVWTFLQDELLPLWALGGWLMPILALTAIVIYFYTVSLYLHLRKLTNPLRIGSAELRKVANNPQNLKGSAQLMLTYALHDHHKDHIRTRFQEVRAAHLPYVDRRLHFISALVLVTPLLGLLGTIIGMLATFQGLGNAGFGQTTDLVAAGVSQALITTQTGLLIAIPGYVGIFLIQRHRNHFSATLTRLESIAIQEHCEKETA